jgi:hypothetical protein
MSDGSHTPLPGYLHARDRFPPQASSAVVCCESEPQPLKRGWIHAECYYIKNVDYLSVSFCSHSRLSPEHCCPTRILPGPASGPGTCQRSTSFSRAAHCRRLPASSVSPTHLARKNTRKQNGSTDYDLRLRLRLGVRAGLTQHRRPGAGGHLLS